jgi:hypothetical protein
LTHFHIPWLPPSANHAYFNIPGGGRTLTSKGKKFKKETSAHIVRHYPTELRWLLRDIPIGLAVRFHFQQLVNKGWPDKAKTRYKKIDASNRLKLLEDAVADATGTDDSQYQIVMVSKVQGTPEATHVWMWDLDKNPEAGDAIVSQLRGL